MRDPGELIIGHRRRRYEQFAGAGSPDGGFEVVGVTQIGHVSHFGLGRGHVVEQSHRSQTVVGHLLHPGDELMGDGSGADHQCRCAEVEPAS